MNQVDGVPFWLNIESVIKIGLKYSQQYVPFWIAISRKELPIDWEYIIRIPTKSNSISSITFAQFKNFPQTKEAQISDVK